MRVPRGDWEPGGTGRLVPLIFQVALVEAALVRAGGYAAGQNGVNASLGRVEDALPLPVWATLFAVAAVLIFGGMVTRTYAPQVIGHGASAAFYAGVGSGVLADAIQDQAWQNLGAANGLIVLGLVLHGGWAFATAGAKRRREIEGQLDDDELALE